MSSAVASPPSPVSWGDRSRSGLGSILDRLAVRAMSFAFDRTLTPDANDLPRVRASAAPYLSPELGREPRRFFAFVDEPLPPMRLGMTSVSALPGGTIVRRTLASDYTPYQHDPDVPSHPENAWIAFEHWRHDTMPAATLIALHGFTMGDPRLDANALMAKEWFQLGLDVVLVTLPFHGVRTPATARYSGELFASWHVGRLNEAVRQSVHDVRKVAAFLREERAVPLGLVGLSLGGYVTALLAGLDPTLAFAIPLAAPVRLGAFPTALFACSRHARRNVAPLSAEELDTAYRVHSPLSYPLALPRERVLLVAGRGDRIVPPEQTLALWRHWHQPALHWFNGSHVTPFRRAETLAVGARHLQRLGILDG